MSYGKAVNRKSFYGSSEMGGVADIAMPSLDESPPIASASQEPWEGQQSSSQDKAFDNVPDSVPEEVEDEMSQDDQELVKPVKQYKKADENLRDIRIAKEKAERERDAMLTQMLEMQAKLQEKSQLKYKEVEELEDDLSDFNVDPESFIEGKQFKRIADKIKHMEKQIKTYQKASKEATVESRIKTQFPDFDEVVSTANIEKLNQSYPDIARSLRDTPDFYSKASAAYNIIKQFGFDKENMKKNVMDSDRMRAITNAAKPRPLASVSPQQGDSPLSKANAFANGMTEELKAQLRREMNAARRTN